MQNLECPLCHETVTSDASLRNYCILCGMGIEDDNKAFCCKGCRFIFKRILREREKRGEKHGKNNQFVRIAL